MSSRFHIFRTLIWQQYPWKTLIFTPPQIHCAFDEDHCHALLISRPGFNTLGESRKRILQALANQIDAFAIQLSGNHSLQSKLNKGSDSELGTDQSIVLRVLVKCIVLDLFCWVLDLGVSPDCFQHRIRSNNDDNRSPVRGYKQVLKTTQTIRTALRIAQSLPRTSTQPDEDGDSYLGLAFATWYMGKTEACAVMANLCFVSVACLCFVHVCDFLLFLILFFSLIYFLFTWQDSEIDQGLWGRITQQFKIDSPDYYNKLAGMINNKRLASWKLWYRAIAVNPILLLDPKFIRSDRSISAQQLLVVSLAYYYYYYYYHTLTPIYYQVYQ